MYIALLNAWPLLFGMGMMLTAGGLQGALLAYRGTIEGMGTGMVGVIMSSFYVGFLFGSTLAPRLVQRVGHIRSFSALASLASVTSIAHILVIEPWFWIAMRLLTGFCYAGLTVIAESWINDRSTNETRSSMLAIYSIINFGGMAAGTLLMNVAAPTGTILFIVGSVLISLGLIPILLTTGPTPSFEAPTLINIRSLYKISPLGVVCCFTTGILFGAVFGISAAFGVAVQLSVSEISLFIAAITLSGMVLNGPIGWLADRFDRRTILVTMFFLAAFGTLIAIMIYTFSSSALMLSGILIGGLLLPLYPLGLAHANDHLDPRQMVSASSSLVLAYGLGAIFGPLGAASAMQMIGPDGFLWFLITILLVTGCFGLYRISRRESVPLEQQGPAFTVPLRGGALSVQLAVHDVRDAMDRDLAWMSRR